MIDVYFGKRAYAAPEAWNELTRRQLLKVMAIFDSPLPHIQGIILLTQILTNIPWWRFFRFRSPHLEDAAGQITGFLLEKNTLTRNLLPKYRRCYGPADGFGNLTMGEFSFTEAFFQSWRNSDDVDWLHKLIAVLYRPKRSNYDHKRNPDGDHREKFNPNLIEQRAKKIARWPASVKKAIEQWYDGCRNQMIEQNPKVFEGGSGEESLHGMWSVMRNVAKAGHFGDFDKIAEQYVGTIMMELNEVVVEAERQEAELKKMKRQ